MIHFPPTLKPLTLTLTPEATTAVLRYHHVTGDDLENIVDGVVVREINRALKHANDRVQKDWRLTAEAIAEAALRREEWQSGDPQDGLTGFEHTVIFALSPAAHALLRAVAFERKEGSVEAFVRKLCIAECKHFAEKILDPERSLFDIPLEQ